LTDRKTFVVADLFAGAGGTSTGCLRAIRGLGADLDLVAVNHWRQAITTHEKNHPNARHYCINLDAASPTEIVTNGYLDLLLASPECTHFSRARGGKPVNDQRRSSAYHVNRWIMALNGRVDRILIENVKEFMEWGPLCILAPEHTGDCSSRTKIQLPPCHMTAKSKHQGEQKKCIHGYTLGTVHECAKIDPETRGRFFFAWVNSIVAMGYDWDWRALNAADYGDATTRERLFVQFVKNGLGGVRWPAQTHGKVSKRSGGGLGSTLKPRRAAKEIIDWSDTGRSLLDDPKYVKRALSEKTRMRIARGLARFGGPLAPMYIDLLGIEIADLKIPPSRGKKPEPFLLSQASGGSPRSTDEPLQTIVGAGYATMVQPFLLGQATNNVPQSVDKDPVPTVTTVSRIRLIEPMIAPYYSTGSGETCSSTDIPLPTVTTKARMALVDPMAVPYGPRADARSVEQPLPTVMTKGRLGVATPTVEPFVLSRNGDNGSVRAHGTADPLPTATARGAGYLVEPVAEPFIVSRQGHNDPSGRVRSVSEPLSTITGSGSGTGYLVEPFLIDHFGEREGQLPRVRDINDPVPAVTSRGAAELVQPLLLQTDQTKGSGLYVRPVDEPVPTVVSKQTMAVVEPVLTAIENCDVDPKRLVLIDGQPYLLDIRFRMLKNRELARAMGFDDQETEYEFTGTQTEITRQIGNAVCVNLASALVTALLEPAMALHEAA
jgi:DNA (cytosine-5)-methyltransferase 1